MNRRDPREQNRPPPGGRERPYRAQVAGRRQFLRSALLLAGASLSPAWATRVPSVAPGPRIERWPGPDQPRQIWLRRKETGEACVARYFDGRALVSNDYVAACRVLRDVQTGTVAYIDVELLDLVFAIQQWLVSWGIDQPLQVHSGYRTVYTNVREGGVYDSQHLRGRALDFSMQGIPADYLGRLVAIFRAGGVGLYPQRNFVHADTGSVRYWRS